jgi:plasmid stabilization system protein ParE
MSREIRFSKRAAIKLENLLNFLEKEWSIKVKNDFILKLNRTLSNIQQFPESFPESLSKKGLRKCVITKQPTIIYKNNRNTINIVTFFDNRQNPDALNKELRDKK